MSEDAKRSGALIVKPNSDDRKPLSAAAAATAGKRVIIKSADMFGDMQKEAVDIAIAAFEKNSVEKDVAESIKKEFDKRHGPTWHCIVGRNFGETEIPSILEAVWEVKEIDIIRDRDGGSYVTHETNHFVYFYLDQKAVLLFKSG